MGAWEFTSQINIKIKIGCCSRVQTQFKERISKYAMLFLSVFFAISKVYFWGQRRGGGEWGGSICLNFIVSVLHFLQENNSSKWKYTVKYVERNLEIISKLPKLEIGEIKIESRAYQVSAAAKLWMFAYMVWRLRWIIYTDVYSLEFYAKLLLLLV